MIKKTLHKVSAVLLSFIVLFSTMSFTVDFHYCGDTLVDTAILQKAENCGMEMEKPAPVSDCNVSKKNCCSDKELVVVGADDLKKSNETLTSDQHLFVASFIYTYVNLFEGLEENETSYKDYSPPLVHRRIYKLDETYLI